MIDGKGQRRVQVLFKVFYRLPRQPKQKVDGQIPERILFHHVDPPKYRVDCVTQSQSISKFLIESLHAGADSCQIGRAHV